MLRTLDFRKRLNPPAGLFLGILLLSLAAAVPFLYRSDGRGRDGDGDYVEKMREQLCKVVAMNVASVENLSYQFIANAELNRMLKAYAASKELYQISEWNAIFSAFLESQGGANPLLRDAAFFDFAESRKKALTMSDNLSSETLREVRSSAFFRKTLEAAGKAEWQGPEVVFHNGRKSLLCGRAITDLHATTPLGVLVLFVRSERLAEIINSELYVDGEPEEEAVGNYFNVILHKSGTILSSPLRSQTGLDLDEAFKEGAFVHAELAKGREKGESGLRWRGSQVFASFQRITGTDFYLLETSTRHQDSRKLVPLLLAALLAAAALIVLLPYLRGVRPPEGTACTRFERAAGLGRYPAAPGTRDPPSRSRGTKQQGNRVCPQPEGTDGEELRPLAL